MIRRLSPRFASLRGEQQCCDPQPVCPRCRPSQPLPPLTHVTQLVGGVFCLSLHSDTRSSLHRTAAVSSLHTEQRCGVFCVVRRWERNQTDF